MNTQLVEDEREVRTENDVPMLAPNNAVVGAIAKAELDQQITTAHAFPRSIKKFINECRDMACLNSDVAAEMFYILPRGGKKIEGPSIRMAEIVQSAWGNCQSGARVVDEGQEFITAQGVFFDLERNVRVTMEVRRRITDRDGRRFNQDMIGVTSAAASSIALRNAIFRGIPKGFWNSIYEEARKVARGDIKSLVTNRTEALDWLAKRGVPNATVLAALGLNGIEDLGLDELETLRGMVTAIKEGETVETVFAAKEVAPPQKKKPETTEPQAKKRGRPPKESTAPTSPSAEATPSPAPAPTESPKPTEATAPGTASTSSITLDQGTFLADSLKEEGIALSLFLAEFQLGHLEELPAAKYANATAWILSQ